MRQTDAQIQQAILQESNWNRRVEETDFGVEVEVDAGVVRLTGTVTSWAEKMAAQQASHRVVGVLDVANDIVVKVPGSAARTDTEIAQDLRYALDQNVFVPAGRIHSTVSNGWVTLEGEVDSWSQSDDAEKAVRNLPGVLAVWNMIEIEPPKGVCFQVQKAIEEALERQAEREAKRIDLEVQEDRVSVYGVVHSWAERDAVIGAAKGTRGVRKVDDHLHIVAYAL